MGGNLVTRKLVLVLATVFACIFGVREQAKADASCFTGTLTAWQTAVLSQIYFYPLCDASGNLKIAGSFSATVTYPYSGTTNGQTATTASFIGTGGLYNTTAPTLTNGQFSPFQLDSSGNLDVNVKVGGGGGSTTFPYSGTTSGQTATTQSFLGEGGIYNSTAPTLSTGQFAPIQLDASGFQEVDVKAGGGSTVFPYSLVSSGQTATTASGVGILGVYNSTAPTLTNTQAAPIQLDANGNVKVIIQNSPAPSPLPVIIENSPAPNPLPVAESSIAVSQAAVSANGTYAQTLTGAQSVCVVTLYSWSGGTVAFQVSGDGTHYNTAVGTSSNGGTYSSVTATGTYVVPVGSMKGFEVVVTGYSAGSVSYNCDLGPTGPTAATSVVTQGTSPWVDLLSAGTNTIGQVGEAAVTGNGATRHSVDTLTTNAVTAICTGPCTGYDLSVINTTAGACYVQEFNTAAGSVTLGTTPPVRLMYVTAGNEAADNIPPTIGVKFSTAWSYAVTTTATGSTACGSTVYGQADYI